MIFPSHLRMTPVMNDLFVSVGLEPPSEPIRVVGVVGIGHIIGIAKLWPTNQQPFLKNILTIPPPSLSARLIKVTFRVSLLTLGGYLVYRFVPVPKAFKASCEGLVHKLLASVREINVSAVSF